MKPIATILALVLTAGLCVAAPTDAEEEAKKKRKAFLEQLGKSFQAGDAKAIAAHFPKEKKVELRLKGVKGGNYRKKQARALLTSYFKLIEPKEYKLKEFRGGLGKFQMKYKVLADGKVVEGTTTVYLKKGDGTWRITGIVES